MRQLKKLLTIFLHPLPPAILAIVCAFLFIDAYTPADVVNYHIPFSIRALKLQGYPDYTGYFDGLFYGFPSFWRYALAPALILDRPRLFLLPNLISLSLFAWLCRRYFKSSPPLVVCCCFVFPVVFFGFRAPLQDFFTNSMVASSMLLLLYPRQVSQPGAKRPLLLPRELFAFALLAIAANVKFQGFFMAFILLLVWLFLRWREASRAPQWGWNISSLPQILLAVSLSLLVGYQPISNIARFGNPFYPVQFAGLNGEIEKTFSPIQYLPQNPLLFNPLSFLVSSTEIDPIIRSTAGWNFRRSWHNFNVPKPQYFDPSSNHPWVMTGGTNGLVFIALALGALISVFYQKSFIVDSYKKCLWIFQRRLLGVSFLYIFLPQVMELRYYMVVPIMVATVAVATPLPSLRSWMRWIVVVGLWFFLLSTFLPPTYFWIRTGVWSADRGEIPPDPYAKIQPSIDCDFYMGLVREGKKVVDLGLPNQKYQYHEILKCFLFERKSRHSSTKHSN